MSFPIMLFSMKQSGILRIPNENDDSQIFLFIDIFKPNVNTITHQINLSSLQMKNKELIDRVQDFVNQHSHSSPEINKLRTFINEIDDGEYFYILPNIEELSTSQMISIKNQLNSHNDPTFDLVKEQQGFEELFSEVFNSYTIENVRHDKKNKIGESNKRTRKCRFCNNTMKTGATFFNEAHAISEALGNKKLILNEECDTCNSYFSDTIEKDMINYFRFHSIYYGVKNKENRIPKLKEKNFEYFNDGNGKYILKYIDDKITDKNQPEKIPLKFREKIQKQNIYKCLCKYSLSIIQNFPTEKFSKTVKWIRSDIFYSKLPQIAILSNNSFFTKEPSVVLYKRKKEDYSIPYCVGEFHFLTFTMVFIIPTFDENELNFTSEEEFSSFFKYFKHFSQSSGWKFESFTDSEKRDFQVNINLEENKI